MKARIRQHSLFALMCECFGGLNGVESLYVFVLKHELGCADRLTPFSIRHSIQQTIDYCVRFDVDIEKLCAALRSDFPERYQCHEEHLFKKLIVS